MTKVEIVKAIAKNNSEPIQGKCPRLILHWTKSDGTIVNKDVLTGEMVEEIVNVRNYEYIRREAVDYIYPKKQRESWYAAIHEMDGQEVLELATISIEANRTGGPKKWKYDNWGSYLVDRVFLFKGSPEIYYENGVQYYPESIKKYNKTFVDSYLWCLDKVSMNYHAAKELYKFTKFDRNYWSDTGEMTYIWQFKEWYKKSCALLPAKKSAMDVFMENLVLPEVNFDKYPLHTYIDEDRYWCTSDLANSKMFRLDVVDGWAVIRMFHRYRKVEHTKVDIQYSKERSEKGYLEDKKAMSENIRILIDPKGKVGIYEKWGDGFRRTPKSPNTALGYNADKNIGYDNFEAMKDFQPLKYLAPIAAELEYREKIRLILDCLRHPVLEQLYKAGYKNIARTVDKDSCVGAELKEMFGIEKETKTPILKLFGVNSYQLKKIDEMLALNENGGERGGTWIIRQYLIKAIKSLTGKDAINGLSNQDTDKYFEIAKVAILSSVWEEDLLYTIGANGEPIGRAYGTYGYYRHRTYDAPLTEEARKKMIKIIWNLCKCDEENLRLYADTVRLFCSLPRELRPQIEVSDIDNIRTLHAIHDDFVQINNEYREEIRRARAEKEQLETSEGFRKRWKPTVERYGKENDEFIITAPSIPAELTTEGSRLGHCVGSYLRRVATSSTTILFLRRKEAPDTPFYTIEIEGDEKNKYPRCIQIHGLGNRWLGNNPEAIPFVKEWLEEKGINYNAELLLCASTGYFGDGPYLDGTPYGL